MDPKLFSTCPSPSRHELLPLLPTAAAREMVSAARSKERSQVTRRQFPCLVSTAKNKLLWEKHSAPCKEDNVGTSLFHCFCLSLVLPRGKVDFKVILRGFDASARAEPSPRSNQGRHERSREPVSRATCRQAFHKHE